MSALKAIWCRLFHTMHLGFSGGGKTKWLCAQCGRTWTKPTTGK